MDLNKGRQIAKEANAARSQEEAVIIRGDDASLREKSILSRQTL